jgi:hypothetical protein
MFMFSLFWDPRSNLEPIDTRPHHVQRAEHQVYLCATRPHRRYTRNLGPCDLLLDLLPPVLCTIVRFRPTRPDTPPT